MKKSEANKKAIGEAVKSVIESKFATPPQTVHSQITTRQEQSFRGPLPPPEILKGYGEVVKDGGERIMAMAEKEQKHAHRVDILRLGMVIVGQIMGFLIIITAIVGGIWLVFYDKPLTGLTAFLAGIGVLLGGGYLHYKLPWQQPKSKKNPEQNDDAQQPGPPANVKPS